jgi:glycosyltransferase involved in cell wall biosynthesis
MRHDLVSIVLPVYNGMPFLRDAVRSIIDQTYQNWELIIVNDGSTDESGRFIENDLLPSEKRIIYFRHEENRGIGAAYNTGIGAANGRFIAFQEQDDVSLPARLSAEIAAADKYQTPFVTSRVAWINQLGQVYKYWPAETPTGDEVYEPGYSLYKSILINQTCFANATTLLDRSLIPDALLVFDEIFRRSGQDWDFHLRLVSQYRSLRLAEPVVWLRRYPEHQSATSKKERIFQDNRRILAMHWQVHQELFGRKDFFAFLRAWSNEFLVEARHFKGQKGTLLGLYSLLTWPTNHRAWHSFRNLLKIH